MALYKGDGTQIALVQGNEGINLLDGKRWLPIGDSITAGGSYRNMIGNLYGLTQIYNCHGDGWQVGYGSGAAYCVLEKLANFGAGNPDIITIALGTNDGSAPIGTINDDPATQTADSYTFMGCYKKLIEELYAKYGRKTMVLLTPFQRNGGGLEARVEAIKEIGRYYSIPVCDVYACGGAPIGTLSDTGPGDYFYTTDGLHLNDAAAAVIAPKIKNAMMEAVERFEANA